MTNFLQSVQYLKGVGPARALKLSKLNIKIINDLIEYFPREWSDRRYSTPIKKLVIGTKSIIRGKIQLTSVQHMQNRLCVFHAYIQDVTGIIDAVWIRKSSPRYDVFSSLTQKIAQNKEIYLIGQADFLYRSIQFKVDDYELVEQGQKSLHYFEKIVPVYPLTEGIDQRFIRSLIQHVLSDELPADEGLVPQEILTKRNLFAHHKALREIHYPATLESAEHARRSLAYEEFFSIEFALHVQRMKIRQKVKGHTYEIKKHLLTPFRQKLSFQFTHAQKRVIKELFEDMRSPNPMYRLLQGDVGSGKTVVAVSAMLLAAENDFQTCLMVPTEILAEQHYSTLKKLCEGLPVAIALIKSKMKKKERGLLLAQIKSGEVSVVIGTHAVIQHDVCFKTLKLVVIDEQHRFGVIQRAALQVKGDTDMLVMTATPIPRTLALTVYGDLDVSVLDEMPKGRQPVRTQHLKEREAYQIVKKEIERKNRVYIVYPLIEESDKTELRAVVKECELLKQNVFASYRVGLIHGHMPHAHKDRIMKEFTDGYIDILMATTVIEVGIDVPEATVMVIQHADRFGLATLHQLRGRIGRGHNKSMCLLIGKPKTPQAKARLKIMQETSDGFRISEEDLRLRGPGEFLGTAQHGIPQLKAGNFVTDLDIIKAVREDISLLHAASNKDTKIHLKNIFKKIEQNLKNDIALMKVG